MCPCKREKGIVCAAHCRREGCGDGWHTDHTAYPGEPTKKETL